MQETTANTDTNPSLTPDDEPTFFGQPFTPDELAAARAAAERFTSAGLVCTPQDVTLAQGLGIIAEHEMAGHDELRTPATAALFGAQSARSQAALVMLAQFVTRAHAGEHETPNELALDLMSTLLGVVASGIDKPKKAKHPRG